MLAILYTAPNTGSLLEVMRRSPTPKISIGPPCINKDVIVYSSKLLDAMILQSSKPASSSMRRAFLAKYARSPESRRIPFKRFPIGSNTSFATLIALGTPEFNTS